MKCKIVLALAFALAGAFFAQPSFALDITTCQNFIDANRVYTLATNVSSAGTCFVIGANNVTLDGNGFWVNYSQSSIGNAIDNSLGSDNITIKNLNIVQGSSIANATAIYGYGMANSTITNNTIQTSGTDSNAIYFRMYSSSNTITNNNITTSGIINYGSIELLTYNNFNVISNNIIRASDIRNRGILITLSDSNTVSDNSIAASGYDGHGIFISSSSSNNVYNNNITTSGDTGFGIYLSASTSNTLYNNNITTLNTGAYGAYLIASSSNTLSDNIITSSSSYGVYLYSDASNTVSNNITGGSVIAKTSYDYYLHGAGTTNNFTNTNLTAQRRIYFDDANSWFNYNNQAGGSIWLKTSVSSAGSLNRTLATWSQNLMKWNDTPSAGITATYSIAGLLANKNYNVTTSSSGGSSTQTLTTDSGGNLPSFTASLSGNTEIKAESAPSPPDWSASSTSKASPQTYGTSNNYGFQINWTDADGNFANASFQLGRPNGLLTNYTISSTPATQNNSGSGSKVWYINFTQDQLGGAGTYNYTWFGIDVSGLQNKTGTTNYVISKATSSTRLFLNGTEGNRKYSANQMANFTVTLDIGGKTVYLYANISGFALRSGTTPLYNLTMLQESKTYNVTGYFPGEENYSASSATYFITNITTITSNLALHLGPLFADDSLQTESNYACISDSGGWFGLTAENPRQAQSGNLTNDYNINVSFTSDSKAFLIMSRGNCNNMRRYASDVQLKKFLSPLVSFSYPKASPLQLALQFNGTDITGDLHWGIGTYLLSIRNEGYDASTGKDVLNIKIVK